MDKHCNILSALSLDFSRGGGLNRPRTTYTVGHKKEHEHFLNNFSNSEPISVIFNSSLKQQVTLLV